MTDNEIIQGLKKGDADITREFFYGYCRMAYHVYDKRYDLHHRADMDFYSLAHDYYLRLMANGWEQLEKRKEGVKLSTWMTGGFRFLVLDKLKTQHDQQFDGMEALQFDVPDDNFAEDVRKTVDELISQYYSGDRRSQGILRMILIGGFKSKEVAEQLGVSPSAVSQRFKQMMNTVVIPYFKRYYEHEEALPTPMADEAVVANEACYGDFYPLKRRRTLFSLGCVREKRSAHLPLSSMLQPSRSTLQPSRITPIDIHSLQENEIFVFGSNLAGMHGGGAAYVAFRLFGAILGQGVGLQGQSYAIPTMQGGVETIRPYVSDFIAFAQQHPDLRFLVTRIGCGVAGFDPEDIAPLFRSARNVDNIYLPSDFWPLL